MLKALKLFAASAVMIGSALPAQVGTIDPNDAGEYEPAANSPAPAPADEWQTVPSEGEYQPIGEPGTPAAPAPTNQPVTPVAGTAENRASAGVSNTVSKSSVLSAAEGVFGRGAEGLAGIIESILSKQGEPDAYIAGSEAGGAIVVGLRYGKGTLYHQAGGDRPVYWTGPSIGFDFGGDANKVFVLVYNLDDAEQLFQAKRFGAAEGNAYVVGGFKASYLRNGNTVLIPIRTGVGVRMGVNAGYMKFTRKGTWLPF
mgnify:CR=1 FL=1